MTDTRDEETHTADQHPYPDALIDGDAGTEPDRGSTESTPRWVFVIAFLVVLLVVLLHLTGILGPGLH